MKKYGIILLVWLMSSAIPTNACNSCGCSAGSGSIGLMSFTPRNNLGMLFQYYRISTYTEGELHGVFSSQRLAVNGAFNINRFWQVQGNIPIVKNDLFDYAEQTENHSEGVFLGDVQLVNRLNFFQRKEDSASWGMHVAGLFGLELPTGAFDKDYSLQQLPASFYPGSDSWDPIIGTQFAAYKNKWILATLVQLKLSTKNSEGYRAGAEWNASVFAAKSFGRKDNWTPMLGLLLENKEADQKYAFEQEVSAYTLGSALVGFEWTSNSIRVGVRENITVISSFASGTHKNPGSLSLYAHYLF